MNWRLIAMALGTLACAAPLVVAPDLLSRNVIQAASFGELAPWSIDSVITAAYVVTTTALPAACVISLARGWLAYARGPKEKALTRLLFWPAALSAASIALYGVQVAATRT
ncbi:MAG: hypothetical protein GC189_14400 [Alphaproteobacteria bacterium]|nr:hypothetical protein [Alphaproteobacteria bacterium]